MFREFIKEGKDKADLNIMKDVYYDMSDAMYSYTRKLYYELDLLTPDEAKKLEIDPKKERDIIKKIEKLFRQSNLSKYL